jgi:hypothetical protein
MLMFCKTTLCDVAQQSITVTEIVRYASRHIKTEAIELLVRQKGAKLSVTSIFYPTISLSVESDGKRIML